VAGSVISSFLSDMCGTPCKLRGSLQTMDLQEPYMVPHGNQGNCGAKFRAAVRSYSTILKS